VPEADHRQVDKQHPDEYVKRVIGFFDRYLAAMTDRNGEKKGLSVR
jgi:hypothetical protein